MLPKSIPLVRAHEMCDEIETKVMERLPNSNLTIHVEPCDGECDNCQSVELCRVLSKS